MALNQMIPRTHMHPELIAKLVEERKTLWREIDRREKVRREAGEGGGGQAPMASEDAMLLERLLRLCQKMSQVRKGKPEGQ